MVTVRYLAVLNNCISHLLWFISPLAVGSHVQM